MNILVTGARGFVGKNLVENLKNIKEGKNRTRPNLLIDEIYEYDRDPVQNGCKNIDRARATDMVIDSGTEEAVLEEYCQKADFVFHLAGVNRPKDTVEFEQGNADLVAHLLEVLKKYNNTAPVMLSSSIQAALTGRYEHSPYGMSKRAGEEILLQYSRETGVRVCVYRFPNLFGKWCRPNYNSAVATFCYAIANDLDYTVNDRNTCIELVYIDDLLEEMLDALEGKEHRCEYEDIHPVKNEKGRFCFVPVSHTISLGEIVDLLNMYNDTWKQFVIPEIPAGSFEKKLYSTYLSYLPKEAMAHPLNMKVDNRGIFTELLKTEKCGQVSINVARPGNVRGEHWHNSKWEIFMVVSGHGLIQERKVGKDENGEPYPVIRFEVTGEQMQAIRMLPGYTHSIRNLSDTENLVTVMWANESFDEKRPDTFFEQVDMGKKN